MAEKTEVSLASLAKEAIELKRRLDELAQKVNDLDVFMREVVMVIIDVLNSVHSVIDELQKKTEDIESVLLGEKPAEILRLESQRIERKAPEVPPETPGPKPPSTPPPVEEIPLPEVKPVAESTKTEVLQPPPAYQASPTPEKVTITPQMHHKQVPQEQPKSPGAPPTPQVPTQQISTPISQPQSPAPSPVPPGLQGRVELIFQLKEVLAKRKKQT